MDSRDRHHPYDDGELKVTLETSDDDDEHGYHTPKNIFNAEMSRLSQLQLACTTFPSPPLPMGKSGPKPDDDENPYSTIKKCPQRSSMIKNLESLIQMNATTVQQKKSPMFYRELSMENMLRELEAVPFMKKLSLFERFSDIDHVDIALCISFLLLVIFGIFGFYIIINEFS
ncbi:unnamed protein product [Angiostrongylus costaricensis]|uniref:SCHIP-1 domain-containing protein n=1 Tax=Angiostrongylus costaricensis TaxID=334426 RepID=A0A158PLL3_ANGCS|nr:unnamed protein product [Angiostrongylus costaricensis]